MLRRVNMLAWHHLLLASISAAGVTLLGHWLMSRADSAGRRAFAESMSPVLRELEEAAMYWASFRSLRQK